MTVTARRDTSPLAAGTVPTYTPLPPPTGMRAVLALAVPLLGVAIGVAYIWLALPAQEAQAIARFAFTYILPLGIFWAGPVNVALGLSPTVLVLTVFYFDAWFALFWIWNLDHLVRFRRIRAFVDRSTARAWRVFSRHRWMARSSIGAVLVVVGLPLPGTGMVSGIVLGLSLIHI